MNTIRSLNRVVVALLAALISSRVLAVEVLVVDQAGNPLEHAYVSIPEGTISSVPEAAAVMDQIDVAFVPHVLAIHQGQSVVFPNSDNIRHHVYSFSEPKRFEIKLYKGVPNSPVQFDKPGLVALGCNIHDSMLGYIFVSPWPTYGVTDKSGTLQFEGKVEEVAVWHPWLKGQTTAQRVPVGQLIENNQIRIELEVTKPKVLKRFSNKRREYDD